MIEPRQAAGLGGLMDSEPELNKGSFTHHLCSEPSTGNLVHYTFSSIVCLAQHDTLCVVAFYLGKKQSLKLALGWRSEPHFRRVKLNWGKKNPVVSHVSLCWGWCGTNT